MPDHMHLLLLGFSETSDLQLAASFLRRHLSPALLPAIFQKQAYDHVLTERERRRDAFPKVCQYIHDNPLRGNLTTPLSHYNFAGCMIPGYPGLKYDEDNFWDTHWNAFEDLSQSHRQKPPAVAVN